MKIRIFQVDAFTNKVFGGNPAAVCPMGKWPDDNLMQRIAAENNLSETAFFVKENDKYRIRWFTPLAEVSLCGHATLASAHVLFHHLGVDQKEITFLSKSGMLTVSREDEMLVLNFPVGEFHKIGTPPVLTEALGLKPLETYKGAKYLALLESEAQVLEVKPDMDKLRQLDAEGLIVTAKGEIVDFVSRFFAPRLGINEDPVTGSAHTLLIPFWAEKYGKNKLTALQLSERKGEVIGRMKKDRVELIGTAVTFMKGEIEI